jgi:hypothetical protein
MRTQTIPPFIKGLRVTYAVEIWYEVISVIRRTVLVLKMTKETPNSGF